MPLDASQNGLVLPLLGLLVEQPSHAYALAARLRERYGDLPATRSTVATLLKSLERAGLVAARLPEQVGNRPARTVYRLTPGGADELRRKVETGIAEGRPASVDFLMAVAYLAVLDADRAAGLLAARADRLDGDLAALRDRPEGVAEAHMLEAAYWRVVVSAEAAWTRTLASRVRSRDIEWPGVTEGQEG
ncbi:PadR family transcriptional regulator [Actinocorallia herbida]|uniref:PadR family transcriptional regulator n=1 Tax=Actinocorallia herbida TaxID=58109 RepID=A0A3N1CSV1_9ACTN|nr:helix-turn-helix transcriptional regulator [Actinocorallia herbida]ROO84397.1 PadR family transcriptional regulator [Actinocorallia herbida]